MLKLLTSVLLLSTLGSCEVFTSMSDMSKLLTTESEMIRTVENYINTQEERLQKLKRNLAEMERVHDIASESPDNFLSNPINAYLLVKRLTIDWTDLQNVLTEDSVGQAMLNNLTSMAEILHWPDEEDLSGIAAGLMRIQDTYKLETTQLARGIVVGMQAAYRELTAGDCFELGRQSYNKGDYYHTMLWMNEAYDRHDKETVKTVTQPDILEYLAFATYMQGHIKRALKLTNSLLELKPNHQRAIGNKVYYEESLKNQSEKQIEDGLDMNDAQNAIRKGYTVSENTAYMDDLQLEKANYEKLCRGEGKISTEKTIKLICYFQHGPGKSLYIGPVKAEIVYHHPTITLYHDMLTDREIESIKELAVPKFKRATVQNYKTGELETAPYRISKSSWLRTDDSEDIMKINNRIGHVTGLNMDTAEELQVANYGIGGHYEPHYDFARREEKDAFKSLGTGNRIATFMFYMSDVEAGGATVFPHLELSLWPEKGMAVFWHNLHPNGDGDLLTRHAACPVLLGQKWVSNKWIHERGQELRRPCGLNHNDLIKKVESYKMV